MEIATYAVLDDGSCIPVKIDPQTFQQKYSDRVIIFVIEQLRRVFIWVGKNASVRQKFISSRVAQQLRMELGLGLTFKVKNVEQGQESTEFMEAIKNATVSKADVPSPVDHVIPTEEAPPEPPPKAPPRPPPKAPPRPPPKAPPRPPEQKISSRVTTPSREGLPPRGLSTSQRSNVTAHLSADSLPMVSGIHTDHKSFLNAWYSGPIILRKAVKLLSTKEMGGKVSIQHVSATSFPVNQENNDLSWWLALFVEPEEGNIKDCRESAPAAIIPFNTNHTTVSLPIRMNVEKGKAIYVSFTNPTYLSLQFNVSK